MWIQLVVGTAHCAGRTFVEKGPWIAFALSSLASLLSALLIPKKCDVSEDIAIIELLQFSRAFTVYDVKNNLQNSISTYHAYYILLYFISISVLEVQN